MTRVLSIFAALAALAVLPATGIGGKANAQAVVSSGQSFVSARLLPGRLDADGTRLAGLRLSMTPGWKTYWRAPGEAGIPPQFDWSASENVAEIEVLWPRPEVFMSFGMRTIGYGGDVVLPIRVTPREPAQPISLAVTADLGVCRDICVLERVTVGEEIPADLRSIGAGQIDRALRRVPVPAVETGLNLAACRISGQGRSRHLEAEVTGPAFDSAPEVLVEGSERLWVRQSNADLEDGVLTVTAELHLPSDVSWVDRSALRFTVLGDGYAADIQGCTVAPG